MSDLPEFFESDDFEEAVQEAIAHQAELHSELEPGDSATSEQWKQLPYEVKSFGISANRYARLLAIDAPPVVLQHEQKVLRPRIERLRTFLDVLEKGLGDD